MIDGLPWNCWPVAALDIPGVGNMSNLLMLGFRLLLALFAAFVAWIGTPPLVRILYRVAFHRPTPGGLVFLGRLTAAGVLAVIVFLYMPLGGGGGFGWGSGGGGGLGFGMGTGSGTGTTAKEGQGTGTTAKDVEPKKANQFLLIDLVSSKEYQGDDRYYLIKGDEPPRTLKEVEDFLKENPGRWKGLKVVLYDDTPSEVSPTVTDLRALADDKGLEWNQVVKNGNKPVRGGKG